jgi:glycosyltransferase involved in cell wall biosynthesis
VRQAGQGPDRTSPDVGVIIPAYNAERTIHATLSSVRQQTYRHLQIVVCDDGSTDDTAAIVARHCADDRRVRLVQQKNAGVAAARNRAAAETDAPLLAPIDADDLWHPSKIERQVEVIKANSSVGLVYVWSAQLDANDRICGFNAPCTARGDVAEALCRHNFTGNGSTVLIRRDVFEANGGYDTTLRQMGAEGCEDWDLHLRIALTHPFGVVEDYLCGYRIGPGSMSRHVRRMWRSFRTVSERIAARRPELSDALEAGSPDVAAWLAAKALQNGHYLAFRDLLGDVSREGAVHMGRVVWILPVAVARGALPVGARARLRSLLAREAMVGRSASIGRPFLELMCEERGAILGRSN